MTMNVIHISDVGDLERAAAGLRDGDVDGVGVQGRVVPADGIFLVTGPTGSGKSTSLYSFLSEVNKIDVRIMTAEDPIEYHMAGINQVQMQAEIGMNFARALRAFLRQDPDIIMVGEIRDRETAEIAINAGSDEYFPKRHGFVC